MLAAPDSYAATEQRHDRLSAGNLQHREEERDVYEKRGVEAVYFVYEAVADVVAEVQAELICQRVA